MPTSVTTTIDTGQVEYSGPSDFDDNVVLTITGPRTIAAGTHVKAGTILARSVANPGKYIIYVKGGASDGNGVPAAVLTYPVEKASAGSGDVAIRPLKLGKVNKRRLVIDADGNSNNVDGVVMDLLRARQITVVDVSQASG